MKTRCINGLDSDRHAFSCNLTDLKPSNILASYEKMASVHQNDVGVVRGVATSRACSTVEPQYNDHFGTRGCSV